jgi:hypothetical protein
MPEISFWLAEFCPALQGGGVYDDGAKNLLIRTDQKLFFNRQKLNHSSDLVKQAIFTNS